MKFIESRNIQDYSELLDGLYTDFGNHFCHTMLCWCGIMESKQQPEKGKFWEVWLVKSDSDEILGICGLYSYTTINTLWLAWFGILPELRSKGIGGVVIEELKDRAKTIGATKLMSYVDEDGKPLEFYKRHGFEVIGRVGNYVKENGLSMEKFEDENDYVIEHTL